MRREGNFVFPQEFVDREIAALDARDFVYAAQQSEGQFLFGATVNERTTIGEKID